MHPGFVEMVYGLRLCLPLSTLAKIKLCCVPKSSPLPSTRASRVFASAGRSSARQGDWQTKAVV